MIDASNFATEDDDRRQMSDVDMIEKARALAAEDNDTDEGPGDGPEILGIPITRRNLIIGAGAAVGGVAAIAVLLSVIGGCSHKEEPKPAPKPQIAGADEDPFAATTTASMDGPVDMMGEQMTVGTALSAGLWLAGPFDPTSDTWLSIVRDMGTGAVDYYVEVPATDEMRALWANQVMLIELVDGDVVTGVGHLERATVGGMPARDLRNVNALRSGHLVCGRDIEAGRWTVTPRDLASTIDTATVTSKDGNVSWQGRLTTAVARCAYDNEKPLAEAQTSFVGLISLPPVDLSETFGPLLCANLPIFSPLQVDPAWATAPAEGEAPAPEGGEAAPAPEAAPTEPAPAPEPAPEAAPAAVLPDALMRLLAPRTAIAATVLEEGDDPAMAEDESSSAESPTIDYTRLSDVLTTTNARFMRITAPTDVLLNRGEVIMPVCIDMTLVEAQAVPTGDPVPEESKEPEEEAPGDAE